MTQGEALITLDLWTRDGFRTAHYRRGVLEDGRGKRQETEICFELMGYTLFAQQQKVTLKTRRAHIFGSEACFWWYWKIVCTPQLSIGRKHTDGRVEPLSSVCYNHYLKHLCLNQNLSSFRGWRVGGRERRHQSNEWHHFVAKVGCNLVNQCWLRPTKLQKI